MIYIALLLLLIAIELLYFKIADKYNIIDKPNQRSSHTEITLRGGGIIFPFAAIIAFFTGEVSWELALAVVLVGLISFIDDIKPLPQLPRFAIHALAVGLVLIDLNAASFSLGLLPLIFILMIGWINAFNFMDGINGITVLYALTAIVGFSFLDTNQTSLPLLVTMGLACVAFGIFNLRKKAKTFAGDVGSISLALFLGYFMIKTIIETGQLSYILFFSIYGIDSVLTIFERLVKKQNIFQPHRTHLYQYLVNEMRYPHVLVSIVYATLQMIINCTIVFLGYKELLSIQFGLSLFFILIIIYLMARYLFVKRIIKRISS